MRMNIQNAISYELVKESDKIVRVENGFNPDTFRIDGDGYRRKTHLILDFGTFERTVWFHTNQKRDEFIKNNFTEYSGCIITK